MSDFVKPEPVRLALSGSQYIDVKKRLNHGEREDMLARMAPHITPGAPFQLERREVRTAKVLAYLLGWSLMDNGKPAPYGIEMPEGARLDMLRSLDPDRFDEMYDAIDAHETKEAEERSALKNVQAGESPSKTTSPSRSAVDGVMSTSVN